jgi:tRNA nucleotidyltransferase (CCA-adding enzyme)
MKIFLVGGAVRDTLLDLPVDERDWVVVGATPKEMTALGFRQIDAEFPVFRHPDTHEEYALARREIKRGPGYRGFDIDAGPDVSLEQDLKRRDLTINAIARAEDGALIDPFGGREDLDAGLLRHVSPAFSEDPLRVLRIARFAAKLGRYGFRVAHVTHALLGAMVDARSMTELHSERVWRETRRALATEQPWRYFEVLQRCGALADLLPELAAAMGEATAHAAADDSAPIAALKRCAAQTTSPTQRLLAMLWPVVADADIAERLVTRLRLDRPTAQLLRRAAAAQPLWQQAVNGDQGALTALVLAWLALPLAQRDPLLQICAAQRAEPDLPARLVAGLQAGAGVDVAALRDTGLTGAALGAALAKARRVAVDAAVRRTVLVT